MKTKSRITWIRGMGLGKTFVGAEKLIQLGVGVNLVICQKSKVLDWIEHFVKNYDVHLFDLTNKAGYAAFKSVLEHEYDKPMIAVINYDLAFRRPDLARLKNFTLLLDESSLIQNENAKRSKFILDKLHPANVILLSGTPTGGKYEKLWSQLRLLGWKISKDLFWIQYVDVEYLDNEGFPIKVVRGYKNIERLKSKMRQYGCRFMKTDEVFDLPAQTFIETDIKPSKEYRRFRKDRVITVGETELVGDTILTKMLYERQLCGQYNADKLEALQDILESTDDRVLVFYNFNEELRLIEDICMEIDKPLSIVNGQGRDLSLYEEYSNSVTAVQYQAGAMGLNLQKANRIVYFTLPLSSELFEQSKKRIHRIGQKSTCFYHVLMCKNSIEERIYENLKMRRDYTDDLFVMDSDDGY
ncbi:MAG: DEAD/DEAH box helicase [Bacteroidaceae bacterium]|nr:DEAD/DEAH box helicase [Bacteroidaceae bacterium]